MATRIYLVEVAGVNPPTTRMVEAVSQWQAIKQACKGFFNARPANAKDVANFVEAGGKIEREPVQS